ncbi:MAG TPA: dienelactone hydrolase family protein [Oculatellaceae cyanobacterium]
MADNQTLQKGIETEELVYQDGDLKLKAFVARPEGKETKLPVVLISHAWDGRGQAMLDEAKLMASLGYVGVALDNYGDARVGKDNDENQKMMMPLVEDRAKLRKRLQAGLEAAKKLEGVDTSKIAILGFCFGGLCALDLARSGADIKGAISFHGLLGAPEKLANEQIKAKILVLHGHDDPMVPPAQVQQFEEEMTKAKVDWQLHAYGQTMHAFMNREANNPSFGTVYNEVTAKRARRTANDFLADIFA